MDDSHIINCHRTLLEALKQLNDLHNIPLVLFVVDDNKRMVGTLTDGDSRRALIAGARVSDSVENIMHRNFSFLRKGVDDEVKSLHRQKELKMKLVPILDGQNHIIEIINLERYVTRLPIDAILMAGGKGERLRPLTEKTPKPLLKVGDKAIIDYNVEHLVTYGVKNIYVTVNYLAEQVEAHFATPIHGIQVHTIREPRFLGTMGSILFVENFEHDTVLVMNSDLFTNLNYEDFYLHFKEHDADMSIAAIPYTVSVPYGIFELKGRQVTGVLEKPAYNYYANAGIYLFKRELVNLIPRETFFNATDFIALLMKKGYKVIRFPLNGTWIDIGNPQEFQKANELVRHIK